jgi:hypothetical protein
LNTDVCAADRTIWLSFYAIIDAFIAKGMPELDECYPQYSLVGMKKTSMQMEHFRQDEIEFVFVNFR